MSILPSFVTKKQKMVNTKTKPIEYGIDFDTGQLTGEIVSGSEAVKVWVWLALHSERYRYPIFSWQYGSELERYIGRGYSEEYLNDAVKKAIKDCLKINSNFKGIKDFSCKMEKDKLNIAFTVMTDYGEVEISV